MDTGRIPLTQHRDAHGTADGGSRGTDQSTTGIRPLVRRRRHSRRRRGVEDTAEVAEAGEQHADPELHLPGMATGCKSRARREGIRKRREGVERDSRSSNRGGGGGPSTLPGVRHRSDGLSPSLRRPASGTLPGVACAGIGGRRPPRAPSPCRWVVSASPLPFSEARARRPRIFASYRMDEAGDARTDPQSDRQYCFFARSDGQSVNGRRGPIH